MFYDMKILFIVGGVLDKYRQVKFGLKYKKKHCYLPPNLKKINSSHM